MSDVRYLTRIFALCASLERFSCKITIPSHPITSLQAQQAQLGPATVLQSLSHSRYSLRYICIEVDTVLTSSKPGWWQDLIKGEMLAQFPFLDTLKMNSHAFCCHNKIATRPPAQPFLTGQPGHPIYPPHPSQPVQPAQPAQPAQDDRPDEVIPPFCLVDIVAGCPRLRALIIRTFPMPKDQVINDVVQLAATIKAQPSGFRALKTIVVYSSLPVAAQISPVDFWLRRVSMSIEDLKEIVGGEFFGTGVHASVCKERNGPEDWRLQRDF